jgi:hypothetical protein
MVQSGINQSMRNPALYCRKKELFYCTFRFNKALDEMLLLKLLILVDKYYPAYSIGTQYESPKMVWNDFAVNTSFKAAEWMNKSLCFKAPFYLQNEDELEIIDLNDGFRFAFHNDLNGQNYLLFNLYADIFTDILYIPTETGYFEEDQKMAASKNRRVLSDCLKSIEALLNADIIEFFTDYYLTPGSIYKYGIKEDAIRTNDFIL